MSNHGRVRNARTGHVRKAFRQAHGHLGTCLWGGDKAHYRLIHRLVLEAFVGPARNGQVCRHLDGNPGNNHVSNLAWGTQRENHEDQVRHGTRARGQRAGVDAGITEEIARHIRSLRGTESSYVVARRLGVHDSTIRRIWNGQTWRWLDA